MATDRTPPPPNIPPPLPLASTSMEPTICQICNQTMCDGDDCLLINQCSHAYHRICIESSLSRSSECPVCKRACQLSDLRKLMICSKSISTRTSARAKSRGAMVKHYNTRNSNRNVIQESHDQANPLESDNPRENVHQEMQDAENLANENILLTPERNNEGTVRQNNGTGIDYNEINRLIESNLTRLLNNFNLVPNTNNNNIPDNNSTQNQHNPEPTRPNNNLNTNASFNFSPHGISLSGSSNMHADKITSVIQNWNLKFDGSANGLPVEEFIYRIQSLTRDTFNGDFTVICRNLHILLTGKARDWYWRYHKQVPAINWNNFCNALRSQYKEFKSSFDIREEIRNRKQKPGESFDSFFDSILTIMDRLPAPMSDPELIEILARNLRPEIRQDLLYVPIHSISQLRRLVQMRENFLNEESVRKNWFLRNQNAGMARRYIAEIEEDREVHNENEQVTGSVDAIQRTGITLTCWNCDQIGHVWENCLQDRTIFCYGCGAKGIYKPNCQKCIAKRQTVPKNFQTPNLSRDSI